MLRAAEKTPHRLVLTPAVLQAHERLATLGGPPRKLTTPGTTLAGPEARPVAVGALLTLVPEALNQLQGLLRGTRYTYFDHGTSFGSPWFGPRGVASIAGAISFSDAFIIP